MLNICVITGPGFGILGPPGGKSHLFFFLKKKKMERRTRYRGAHHMF